MFTVKQKLNSERVSAGRMANALFAAFWGVNALTTFLFGMQFISALFAPIVAYVPISAGAVETVSALLGGFAALLVLDVAYARWQAISIHVSETAEQFTVSRIAAIVSFVLSVSYTALALLTIVFSHLLSADQSIWLDWFGALSFVAVSIMHLICWQLFEYNSPATREAANATRTQGHQLSEKLAFEDAIARDALLNASEHAAGYAVEISQNIGAAIRPEQSNRLSYGS